MNEQLWEEVKLLWGTAQRGRRPDIWRKSKASGAAGSHSQLGNRRQCGNPSREDMDEKVKVEDLEKGSGHIWEVRQEIQSR